MKTSILLIFICFVASVYSLPTIETDDLQNYQDLKENLVDYANGVQVMLSMNTVPCSRGRTRAPWGKCILCGTYYNFFHKEGEGCPLY